MTHNPTYIGTMPTTRVAKESMLVLTKGVMYTIGEQKTINVNALFEAANK